MKIEKTNIYLIAGFNECYLNKSMTYLESMNYQSNINNIIVTLDFDISLELRGNLNNIKFIRINSEQVRSANSNKCMQHGAFLEVLDFISDDSVVIFTDTDINIQRPFYETELQLLGSCKDKDVFVNLNMSEEQTLLMDTEIFSSNIPIPDLIKKYPEIVTYKSYNTGVICARCGTYRQIYKKYNEYWPEFSPLFDAYVKQQFLLTYVIQKYFHLIPLPYSIHAQANSIPVKECSHKRIGYIGDNGSVAFKLCIGSEIVVFNHHIKHELVLINATFRKKIRNLYKIISILIVLLVMLLLVVVI